MPAFATGPEARRHTAPARPADPVGTGSARAHGRIPLYATALGAMRKPDAEAAAASPEAPPLVHQVLRSPGAQLDPAVRATMEPRFGHDFGKVRVHADARAAESAAALGAAAYTVGSDVVFARGSFAADTPGGSRLLAHELAHVVQQSGNRPGEALSVAPADSAAEREADAAAGAVLAGGSPGAHRFAGAPAGPPSTRAVPVLARVPAGVQRQPQTKTKYPTVATLKVVTAKALAGKDLESTVRVKVASADEETEAKKIINDLQFKYEITFNSDRSLEAVKSDVKGDPMDRPTVEESLRNPAPRPLKEMLKTTEWDLPQLRALKEAMAFFDPKIAGLSSLAMGGKTMAGYTFGRVNVGINDAGDARDRDVLGQHHGSKSAVTLFDAAATGSTRLQDPSKALTGTFVHELAHALMVDVDGFIKAVSPAYWTDRTTPTGDAKAEAPVTPYGHKNAAEDLSEATKFFFLERATLQAKCPQRDRYIARVVAAWTPKGPTP